MTQSIPIASYQLSIAVIIFILRPWDMQQWRLLYLSHGSV